MKFLLEVCLVTLALVAGDSLVAAQSTPGLPMQRGIAVNQPVMHNAAPIPDADREDAVVVTVTQDGSVYLGLERTSIAVLSGQIKNRLSDRKPKILYIKADAHAPYSIIVGVLDSLRGAGIQELGLLTAQDSDKRGTLVAPKGLEILILSPR